MFGLVFAAVKLGYNLAYFVMKYEAGMDNLYLGLMIANLLVISGFSLFSRKKAFVCKLLGAVAVLGLFIESFQWYVYIR